MNCSRTMATALPLVLICLELLVPMTNGQHKRNYVIEMTKVNCFANHSSIKAIDCTLTNDSNRQVLAVRLELNQVIEKIEVRNALYLKRNNMPRMNLYDVTMNGCEFLGSVHKNKIFSIVKELMLKHVNVVPKCPLKKDFNYT
ncbi:uncharacterized protein LOC142225181 [Haematobia irritans]|uniref:uncharacterized protein LOC142225181 n=1 Tax=Haematobia irritans TaxID=7368 RepID=UPI003F500ACD